MQSIESLLDKKGPVAVVVKEYLRPVAGHGSVIFPPTYAGNDGYQIDPIGIGDNKTNRCVLDSVQSQANRIEPVFMDEPYSELVPQIVVKAGDVKFNVLEMAHRLADASARFSSLGDTIDAAFKALSRDRNAMPVAKLSPLSLVLGVWDSRGTGVKVQRFLGSTVFADDVSELRRSAQFVPAFSAENVESLEAMKKEIDKKASTVGLAHVPSDGRGGVIAEGPILRESVLNLIGLRQLRGANENETSVLQRYLLGLALVALTLDQDYTLRSGCQLVRDADRGEGAVSAVLVFRDGIERAFDIDHESALAFAQVAAEAFGVEYSAKVGEFDIDKAKKYIKDKA
jgi:CRISPR-associated protein Csb1